MTLIKHESGKTTMPVEQIDSPSTGDGSSGEPVAGGDGLKKGPWTSAEDTILTEYVKKHGDGNWNNVQKYSGLSRCGKSCRLRWANHLRPNLKKGTITPEEERKIIQLHSQMGNKWARMAVMLPGRTDNEIKNYWNTRAKRCERTGLPLHPPEICFDASNNNFQNQDVSSFATLDKHYNQVTAAGSTYDAIPEIIFDYKFNPGLISYASYVPDTSLSIPTSYGFVDPTGNHVKRLRETETTIRGFCGSLYGGLPTCEEFSNWPSDNINQNFPLTSSFDPDSSIKNTSSFDNAVRGSLDLSNVNFSSSRPLPGTAELELPSFQNPETEISNWITCPSSPLLEADSYIQSPLATTSTDVSPRNSGLLEAVPQQGLSSTKNQQSQTIWGIPEFTPSEMLESSACDYSEANWGDNGDPVTPLCNNSASVFSETPPFSASSSDEFQSCQAKPGSEPTLKTAIHMSTASFNELDGSTSANPDFSGPDGSYTGEKGNYMLSDVIKVLLTKRNQLKQMPPGTTPSPPVQGPGSECYPLNNTPLFSQSSPTP